MPNSDLPKWPGYQREIAEQRQLTVDRIKRYVAARVGQRLDGDKGATVLKLADNGVVLELPSGKHTVSFREIVGAEKILRYYLAKGVEPGTGSTGQFRFPDDEIGIDPIADCYYAPKLAELIRRADWEGVE